MAFKLFVVAVQEDKDEDERGFTSVRLVGCVKARKKTMLFGGPFLRSTTLRPKSLQVLARCSAQPHTPARIPTAAPATLLRAVILHFLEGGCSYHDDEVDVDWVKPVKNRPLVTPETKFRKVRND